MRASNAEDSKNMKKQKTQRSDENSRLLKNEEIE